MTSTGNRENESPNQEITVPCPIKDHRVLALYLEYLNWRSPRRGAQHIATMQDFNI